jgi:hypothetical protein
MQDYRRREGTRRFLHVLQETFSRITRAAQLRPAVEIQRSSLSP